jgi:hypothetical protein
MSATGIRMKNPAHPGGFVKTEIIEPLELSVTAAAEVLGVTRPALSARLNERAQLSSEMAADREGVRSVDGHADAHAEQLRHCGGSQARGRNQRRALPAAAG